MVHRCKCLCFTSQLWLPYLAFCFDLPGCFQGLHVWSRIMGSKSGKLQYMLQIVTVPPLLGLRPHETLGWTSLDFPIYILRLVLGQNPVHHHAPQSPM